MGLVRCWFEAGVAGALDVLFHAEAGEGDGGGGAACSELLAMSVEAGEVGEADVGDEEVT